MPIILLDAMFISVFIKSIKWRGYKGNWEWAKYANFTARVNYIIIQ
jgi:hypothetical protein